MIDLPESSELSVIAPVALKLEGSPGRAAASLDALCQTRARISTRGAQPCDGWPWGIAVLRPWAALAGSTAFAQSLNPFKTPAAMESFLLHGVSGGVFLQKGTTHYGPIQSVACRGERPLKMTARGKVYRRAICVVRGAERRSAARAALPQSRLPSRCSASAEPALAEDHAIATNCAATRRRSRAAPARRMFGADAPPRPPPGSGPAGRSRGPSTRPSSRAAAARRD